MILTRAPIEAQMIFFVAIAYVLPVASSFVEERIG
jgi:hypothetical protein